jgi:hypothetical protein
MIEGLVGAEVLGRNVDLNLKEMMWLLQNEPFDDWKKLAMRSGDNARGDYNTSLQKAVEQYRQMGIAIS